MTYDASLARTAAAARRTRIDRRTAELAEQNRRRAALLAAERAFGGPLRAYDVTTRVGRRQPITGVRFAADIETARRHAERDFCAYEPRTVIIDIREIERP